MVNLEEEEAAIIRPRGGRHPVDFLQLSQHQLAKQSSNDSAPSLLESRKAELGLLLVWLVLRRSVCVYARPYECCSWREAERKEGCRKPLRLVSRTGKSHADHKEFFFVTFLSHHLNSAKFQSLQGYINYAPWNGLTFGLYIPYQFIAFFFIFIRHTRSFLSVQRDIIL